MTTFEKQQRYVEPAPGAMFSHEAPESSTGYSADETEAAVPRPALTPGERLHLEINGCERTRQPTKAMGRTRISTRAMNTCALRCR